MKFSHLRYDPEIVWTRRLSRPDVLEVGIYSMPTLRVPSLSPTKQNETPWERQHFHGSTPIFIVSAVSGSRKPYPEWTDVSVWRLKLNFVPKKFKYWTFLFFNLSPAHHLSWQVGLVCQCSPFWSTFWINLHFFDVGESYRCKENSFVSFPLCDFSSWCCFLTEMHASVVNDQQRSRPWIADIGSRPGFFKARLG